MTSEVDDLPDPDVRGPGLRTPGRVALWTFVAAEAIALPYFLIVGRHLWFSGDEWDFLAGRSLSRHDLLVSHGGHLVALPLAGFRVLFTMFGLRSYLPYLFVVVALHLVAAALLRVVMRRMGVRPWIATIAALPFLFFGAGAQNILWAFQMAFVGSVVFGLTQLLLADHDGSIGRRDGLALAAGLGALLCSAVGVALVVLVGVAVLIRRGWRAAALQVVPLAVLYGLWSRRYSRAPSTSSPTRILRWTARGIGSTFDALGQVPFVGWVIGAVLVVGLFQFWRSQPRDALRRRVAVPAAFLVAAVAFLAVSGYTRARFSIQFAASSRYLYVVAALLLPPLAVAADALVSRWRAAAPILLVLALVGLPGNIGKVSDYARDQEPLAAATRQLMLSIPREPLARSVPPPLRPDPNTARQVTVGWLLQGVADGRIPEPRPPTAREALTNRLRLSLMEIDEPSRFRCRVLTAPTIVRLDKGGEVGLGEGSVLVVLDPGPGQSSLVAFGKARLNASNVHRLVAVAGPLELKFFPAGSRSELCLPQPR